MSFISEQPDTIFLHTNTSASPTPTLQGTWQYGKETHTVKIIEKSFISLEELQGNEETQNRWADAGTHILLLDRKFTRGEIPSDDPEVEKAFKDLVSRNFMYRVEGTKTHEKVFIPPNLLQYMSDIHELCDKLFSRESGKIGKNVLFEEDLFRIICEKKPDGSIIISSGDIEVKFSEDVPNSIPTDILENLFLNAHKTGFWSLTTTTKDEFLSIKCEESYDGTFIVSASFPKVHLAPSISPSPENQAIFEEIKSRLKSGERFPGEEPFLEEELKPALPLLLQEADMEGTASTFVSANHQVYEVTVTKEKDNSFSINYTEHFSSPKVHLAPSISPSPENQAIFDEILFHLKSGERLPGEKPKPAWPLLLQEAETKGTASIFIVANHQVYQVIITKKEDNSFSINYTKPHITEKDIEEAHLTPEEISFLRREEDQVIQYLFYQATTHIRPEEGKQKAIYPLVTANVQLHVKKDRTVTIGMGTDLSSGASKAVQQMEKLGVEKKLYAEAILLNPTRDRTILKEEAQSMKKFAGPHILAARKFFVRTVLVFNSSTKESALTEQVGIKSEFCDKGSVFSLIETPPPPITPQEQLRRIELMYQTAQGLAHIHQYKKDIDPKTSTPIKYAHMDIKPENIFIKTEGSQEVVKIGDINPKPEGKPSAITKIYLDKDALLTGLSQEGDFYSDQAADVWALGLTLFETVYGGLANPFIKEVKDEASFKEAHEKLIGMLGHSPEDELIRKMCTLEREGRAEMTQEFLDEFSKVVETIQIQTTTSQKS